MFCRWLSWLWLLGLHPANGVDFGHESQPAPQQPAPQVRSLMRREIATAGGEIADEGAHQGASNATRAALLSEDQPDEVSEDQSEVDQSSPETERGEDQSEDQSEVSKDQREMDPNADEIGCHAVDVPETQREYSSIYGAAEDPAERKLYGSSQIESPSAWSAKMNQGGQFMQMDLGSMKLLGGVYTKGRGDADQWVEKYKLYYSNDAVIWDFIGTYEGNFDRNTVTKALSKRRMGRYIRLVIEDGGWHSWTSLRAAAVVCNMPPPVESTPQPELAVQVANETNDRDFDDNETGNDTGTKSGCPTLTGFTTAWLGIALVTRFSW